MTERFTVFYTHTSAREHFDTYETALAAIESVYSDPEVGHDGDISDGGELTLVWADAESADNDDGSRAVAVITRSHVL